MPRCPGKSRGYCPVSRLLPYLLFAVLLTFVPARAQTVFDADFESGAGAEWTNRTTEQASLGRRFLGSFSSQTVGLMLNDLPPHGALRVAFDLFIIRSWDGNVTTTGPDVFDLRVAGGLVLLHTTFSNVQFSQAYPGHLPGGDHPARTGAVENNVLGYTFGGPVTDSVYRIVITFPHTDATTRLDFSAMGLEGIENESWGLDNVSVVALPSLGDEKAANGDMELPDEPGNGATFLAGDSFGGWNVTAGTVDLTAGYFAAASGKQSVDLTGSSRGTISQPVPTEPGRAYVLRFAMAGHPLGLSSGAPPVKQMRVFWGSTLLDTLSFDVSDRTTYDMGWRYQQYNVVGDAVMRSTNLRFESLTDGFFGPTLDMVSVVPGVVAGVAGDANGDGRVDVRDASLAVRMWNGTSTKDSAALARSDVYPWIGTGGRLHGDGAVTKEDIATLLRLSGGLPPQGTP